jgi:hypothetical protein
MPTQAGELSIPAFTAYMLPNAHSTRISESMGIVGWKDAKQSVNWYGKFESKGSVQAKVELKGKSPQSTRLKMTVQGQSKEAAVVPSSVDGISEADFGAFEIQELGFVQFQLAYAEGQDENISSVHRLVLSGAPADSAHFNLKERRNAASVHLAYPVPDGKEVAAFYCEVTGVDDPTATFYMACGWHRGYFGMQVNSEKERRIIFSVWDSGNEAVDRKNVNDENRVKLMGKGDGVYTGDFGNEGTGGHSHLKYMWKTGETQRFVVTALPTDETFTTYSGYWWHPENKSWMLISSWKAPKEGGWLKGLHSFSENFDGSNGHLRRKAKYSNQWIRTSTGQWIELGTAKFSHDPTGKADRLDRFMGVEDGSFFLSHGGFVDGYCPFGERFERPLLGKEPDLTGID